MAWSQALIFNRSARAASFASLRTQGSGKMIVQPCGWSLLIPLAATALLLAACQSSGQPASQAPQAPGAAASQSGAAATAATDGEFDRQFIDMMVPHHEGAIEMARIAQSRLERPELKHLSLAIVQSQESEVSQMRRWRQQWFGSGTTPSMTQMPGLSAAPPPAGAPRVVSMAADFVRLRSAPSPVDVTFIDLMVPHHESAVEAARLAEQRATRAEIGQLAKTILDSQQREIDQLRQWRQAWYGAAGGAASPSKSDRSGEGIDPDPGHVGH